MTKQIALYPVALASAWDDEPFDASQLPVSILPGLTVETVRDRISKNEFDHFKGYLAKRDIEELRALNAAIVYRYDLDIYGNGGREAQSLVRNAAACLRLIRPTMKRLGFMHGEVRSDSMFTIRGFDSLVDEVHVPMVQRLFAVRNRDLDRFRKIIAEFMRAMTGEFWKFRIPLETYESGHFAHYFWKGKFVLWCSALDAIYVSQPDFGKPNPFEHSGSRVAKARIRWFLGENTCIYAPGDIQTVDGAAPKITVGSILDDLFELRNAAVHGDRTPKKFFEETRLAYGLSASLGDVLHEALSFIVRSSLLRILEDGLLGYFADGPSAQAYFGKQGLVNSLLPKVNRP